MIRIRTTIRLAVLVGAIAAGTAASADVLVVRSLGNAARTYATGRSLPDNASLTLTGGDTVTILTTRGTRTFRGPGRFSVAATAAAGGMAGAFAGPRTRARIGAVRGPAGPPTLSPWQIDAFRSGTACVADPANVTLWRADPSDRVRLSIASEDKTQNVDWPAGASTLQWPAAIPVRAGADYRLAPRGRSEATRLRILAVPNASGDNQAIAATLIRFGCTAQLDRMLAALPPG